LYYETSTSGNFVTLNDDVRLSFTGVDGVTESVGDFYESDTIGTAAVHGFSFIDADGTVMPSATAIISAVVDNLGVDQNVLGSEAFALHNLGGGIWNLETLRDDFIFHNPPAIRTFTVSYTATLPTIDGPLVTQLTGVTIVSLLNTRPNIDGFRQGAASPSSGVLTPINGVTDSYLPATASFGVFEGDNGSASASQTNLRWELDSVTPVYPFDGTWAIDCLTGELTIAPASTTIDTTYKVTVFARDVSTCTLGVITPTADTLSNRQSIYVQIGTPSTPKAICADSDGYPFLYQQQPNSASTIGYGTTPTYHPPGVPGATTQYPLGASGWYAGAAGTGGYPVPNNGGGNTSADQGHPVEYYFGKKGYNNAQSPPALGGTETQAYFNSVPTMADFTTGNTGGGGIGEDPVGSGVPGFTPGICFYNVVERNNTACGGWPVLTTGALTQGTLAIWVRLITVGAAPLASVTTNYTIIYRATDSDPWQQATPTAVVGHPSPTKPGLPVGVETLTTDGAIASEEATALYFFDTPGEYVVRNNGFVITPGQPAAHAFMINFWDAHEGTRGGTECVDCTGPS